MVMTRPTELTYIRTITDTMFTFLNDQVAVGRNKFYITKFWQSQETFREYIEMMLRMKSGGIMYYDGRKAREVVTGLLMTNGINISPDRKMVYVAEFNSKKLLVFSRDSTNNLRHAWILRFKIETIWYPRLKRCMLMMDQLRASTLATHV